MFTWMMFRLLRPFGGEGAAPAARVRRFCFVGRDSTQFAYTGRDSTQFAYTGSLADCGD